MTDKHYSWESVYEDLLTGDYKEILDQETESGRYYEIYWMIKHFKEAGEIEKTNFLIELEEKIERIEGRKLDIGDRFIIDDENVKCIVEITNEKI